MCMAYVIYITFCIHTIRVIQDDYSVVDANYKFLTDI